MKFNIKYRPVGTDSFFRSTLDFDVMDRFTASEWDFPCPGE